MLLLVSFHRKQSALYPALWDVTLYNRNRAYVACISRAIEQRDDRNDICWLDQVPARQRLLGACANSDREDVVDWQLRLSQRTEHIWDCQLLLSVVVAFHCLPSSVKSSPRQRTNSGGASPYSRTSLFAISPLLTNLGRTSRLALPVMTSTSYFLATVLSSSFWHSRAWNAPNSGSAFR
jgi:hypothetical protein